jgi:quercetin dioxygenase-like cupin family protein
VAETALVPRLEGSPLALSLVEGDARIGSEVDDSLLYVISGSGTLTLEGEAHPLAPGGAALVLAGEESELAGGDLCMLRATVAADADRHAPLGPRETVVRADVAGSGGATGGRSYEVLLGPHNGSTRATLFVGHVPAGRAQWHFHLYDEIVWIPEGPARLHAAEGVDELGAGSAFRLRPRQVHIVENASTGRELTVVGVFTPAGSPSAAYLADAP